MLPQDSGHGKRENVQGDPVAYPKTAREPSRRTDPSTSPKSVVYATAFWMGIWPCIGAIHLLTLSGVRVLDFVQLFIGATLLYLGRHRHSAFGEAMAAGVIVPLSIGILCASSIFRCRVLWIAAHVTGATWARPDLTFDPYSRSKRPPY